MGKTVEFLKPVRSGHRGTRCPANIDSFRVKPVQALDVHTKVVGRDSLAMKRIDATSFTKEVTRGFGAELVFGGEGQVAHALLPRELH
jgi:hypothetical protein